MDKSVKILILIFFQIITNVGCKVKCQNSFSYRYSTLSDEMALDGVETSDGGFIVSAKTGTYSPYSYNARLIRLSHLGDTIKTKNIIKSAGTCMIADLLKAEDGNFFGIGIQESTLETKLWLLKINPNLDVLLDTTYSIGQDHISYFFGFIDHKDNLMLYGSANSNNAENHPFIYRLTQEGDSLFYRYFPDPHSQLVYSMIEKPDTSGYYMMIWGQYQVVTSSGGQILALTDSLEISAIDSLPADLNLFYNAKVINSHQFFLTGKKHFWNERRTDQLGIVKLDTSFNIYENYLLGPEDTINYPGYFCNLDFIDTNNIYYGGTCNQATDEFSANKSYYLLGKFDSGLNLKWQKFFGGDMYYSLWGITATTDGGCLLSGSVFNYLTQNMERDVFVIKTDSIGVLTSSGDKPEFPLHDLIVYPNPGTDYFVIESGPQIKGDRLIMWDLKGKQVANIQINESPTKVDTKLLPEGTCIWQLVKENRIIDSGKWVKKCIAQ